MTTYSARCLLSATAASYCSEAPKSQYAVVQLRLLQGDHFQQNRRTFGITFLRNDPVNVINPYTLAAMRGDDDATRLFKE